MSTVPYFSGQSDNRIDKILLKGFKLSCIESNLSKKEIEG